MKKLCLAFLMLALAIVGGTHLGLAQDLQEKEKTSDDEIASMLRDGWTIKQDGVLQRDRGPHQTESFVFGSAGFTWKLQGLQKQLRNRRQAYSANPSPELRRVILSLRKAIASTEKMIAVARTEESSGKTFFEKTNCAINFGYTANASYLTSQQGVTAGASVNFSSNCYTPFTAEVYATSYSWATVNGAPIQKDMYDGPRSGSNVSASVNTSQTGLAACQSYGYASMTMNGDAYSGSWSYSYVADASNFVCPLVTPTPTITGANSILATTGCVTTTWTASATGGTSPYTYQWTWNGANVGTGSTYSRSTCPGSSYNKTTNTLGLTATDSAGNPGSTSTSVIEEKDPPLTLTFSVSPTSTSASPIQLNGTGCTTVTWTANPSGGTTPRTTTIYVNGASVGTGNSYSKSYCNSGTNVLQTIPAYAVVTDSAGASKTSATVNTYIQNHTVTPLAVSVSVTPTSSSSAPINLYDDLCVTVTWTTSISGGTTPYTKALYINGVSVGNVATYSRTYCNTGTLTLQTIPAYATVTDGAGTSKTSTTVNTYIQNHKVITEPTCGQYAC
jgi:hypothetical protein